MRGSARSGTAWAWLVVYGVWGSSYLAMQFAATSMGPLRLSGWRGLLGGAVLWLVLKAQGQSLSGLGNWRAWRDPTIVGVLIIGVSSGLLAWGVRGTSSGMVAVLFATMPIFTWALQAAIAGSFTWKALLGSLLGIAGTALVYQSEWGQGISSVPWAILLSAAVTAVASVWTERGRMPENLLASACMQLLAGGVAATLASSLTGEAQGPWTGTSARALLYLGAVVSALGFWAFNLLTTRFGATAASTYAYVNPLVALALGALWQSEQLRLVAYLGMAVVLVGVYLVIHAGTVQRLR